MTKIIFITDYNSKDRRGGGISSAICNLKYNIKDKYAFSEISLRDESGRMRFCKFYSQIIQSFFFDRKCVVYISGIFNVHSNILPVVLAAVSRTSLIVSPRGMLKETALIKSKKKLFFIKFLRFFLSKKSIIHVTDATESLESLYFFPAHKHVEILDFPPPRIENFPTRNKVCGELQLLYVGRIDELKNLKAVLESLLSLSFDFEANIKRFKKKINLIVIGEVHDPQYFQQCLLLKEKIEELGFITCQYKKFVRHEELQEYYLASHCYISLSKGENYGYTIAEALSCALPVLISPNSPFGQISHCKIGAIVKSSDINAVSEKIFWIYNLDYFSFTELSVEVFNSYDIIFNTNKVRSNYNRLFLKNLI